MKASVLNNYKAIVLLLVMSLSITELVAQRKKPIYDFGFHITTRIKKIHFPFQLISNLIVVPVRINNSDTLNFIFDTGVSNVIVTDPKLAQKLKLKKNRSVKISGAGSGDDQMAYVSTGHTVRLGKVTGYNQNLVILENDFLDISQILGLKIHGLIGYDIFNYFAVTIDFPSSQIFLQDPDKYRYRPSKGDLFKISVEDSKPYLDDILLEAEGKQMTSRLMVDTGAGHAVSLELKPSDPLVLPKQVIRSQLGKGLNGIIDGHLGRLAKVNLGRFELKEVIASFPDSNSVGAKINKAINRNGNLGCDILKKFVVTFNYRDKYMVLKPVSSRLREPFEYNMSGMEFVAKGELFKEIYITKVEANSPGYEAGFMDGDQVLMINGVNYQDESLSNIYKILQNKEGKKISLLVKRGEEFYFNILQLKRLI